MNDNPQDKGRFFRDETGRQMTKSLLSFLKADPQTEEYSFLRDGFDTERAWQDSTRRMAFHNSKKSV